MYQLSDYDFTLPEELISHAPEAERTASRLLCLGRTTGDIHHRRFSDLTELLNPSDLLVVNNTRVVPARLHGHKETGGKVEILILDYAQGLASLSATGFFECDCLAKSSKRPRIGSVLSFENNIKAVVKSFSDGIYRLSFRCEGNFEQLLEQTGQMPLPPYIKRGDSKSACNDKFSYQTVYAREKGAVAAPTAGLHFTGDLMDTLKEKGVEIAPVTLHVGYGTFVPVRVDDIRDHDIHTEKFYIPHETASAINKAKDEGRRVIAVGTTSVRTLEYSARETGRISEGSGNCNLFIYPGYEFKIVDAMITNFHIPESTLLMLVSAFAGRESIMNAYKTAIEERYRFYSYGDAMFIA